MMRSERIVLHLDMDAFFASVEERDKPRLRGLPIVVGADPKGGAGRGVVSTANYKAREYGIKSAMPISEAWRKSEIAFQEGKPRAIFLEGSFRRYAEVSEEIMNYLRSLGGTVEQASVDEAYIELNPKSEYRNSKHDDWKYAEEKAREIKEHIKKKQGLTCSIGIGPNKLIAKIAAGREKPDGFTIVRSEQVQDFLDPLSAKEIPGIGPKSYEALERHGVKTIRDLRTLSEGKLNELFGKWGSEMFRKARGIDDSPLVEEREAKSIGEQETYERDTLDPNFLVGRLKELSAAVAKRLKSEGFSFRTVSIIVRFADFETKTRAHTIAAPANDVKTIEREALGLFLPFLDKRENPQKKLVRLLGVRVEKLE